jgi:hypothetical protein
MPIDEKEPAKTIDKQYFNRENLIDEDTGNKIKSIGLTLVAFPCLDICYKCALQFTLTEIKKEIESL